ncbi:MAG: hypothetical protein LC797_15470 [Chloroflexi bacterium]|nr:hypothetical protein [Chloroflexota bacterium]
MSVDLVALPAGVEQAVLDLAGRCDLLLFGELHGTREVPGLVAALLSKLESIGFGGLGLEAPADQRQALADWATGQASPPPPFYAQPSRDGRASIEALGLVQQAAALGWAVLCFDQAADPPMQRWAERDAWMAHNLLEQWAALCNGRRVVAVCGSLHARLAPAQGVGRLLRKAISSGDERWPSLAAAVRARQPALAIGAIDVRFGGGTYVNMGERSIFRRPGVATGPWVRGGEPAFTLELWLPRANPATFLANPR